MDMCGDGHGGLGEWLVNVDEKVTNTTFMLLKCSNCIINSNRTVEVLYFFNDMIYMYVQSNYFLNIQTVGTVHILPIQSRYWY